MFSIYNKDAEQGEDGGHAASRVAVKSPLENGILGTRGEVPLIGVCAEVTMEDEEIEDKSNPKDKDKDKGYTIW